MRFNYEKKLDLLYVRLKNCPNHYVDQLKDKDKDFGLWQDSETDEKVGVYIGDVSKWVLERF